MAAAAGDPGDGVVADLGSGGGVPALVLAMEWPRTSWVLVESQQRRAAFLRQAVESLGMTSRVDVLEERAEETGRGAFRGICRLVTARSFGPPAVVAECAAPLLMIGGHLVVSEPPGGAPDRWDPTGLAQLGMALSSVTPGPPAVAVLRQVAACADRYPRRVGIPTKRPLF